MPSAVPLVRGVGVCVFGPDIRISYDAGTVADITCK